MTTLYFWIGLGVFFLILESLTATFYGLALALASTFVALYVWIVGDTSITLVQWALFLLGSTVLSFLLPNYLKPSGPDTPQGMDRYIGEKRKTKKVWDDLKITLDGVAYIIEWEGIEAGDSVLIGWFAHGKFIVSKI